MSDRAYTRLNDSDSFMRVSFNGSVQGDSGIASSSAHYGSASFNGSSNTRTSSNLSNNPLFPLSDMENSILKSQVPIEINTEDNEEITVLGQRGLWLNKNEVINWRGPIPFANYPLNDDPCPEIIRKNVNQELEYVQEVAIRYLRPPTPPAPGALIIEEEADQVLPQAPPLIIRQQPPRPLVMSIIFKNR
jgi:hypothetical protein